MLSSLERGDGSQKLLLLHGFLGSGRNLYGFAGRLCEGRANLHCRLPDLLGHGASPPLPPGPTLADVADATVSWLDSVGWVEPIDVLGHSLGGRVALAMAQHAPQRVRRVILLDMAPGPVDTRSLELAPILSLVMAAAASVPSRDEMREWFTKQGVSRALADWLMMNLTAQPDGQFAWRFDRERLAALNEGSSTADLWSAAEALGERLTFVRGGRSTFVTDEDVERGAKFGIKTHTIADAGHFVHVDGAEALAKLVLDWL